MAGKGPAPKPASERRRRNADPIPTQVVAADGVVRGPELPKGYDWHMQTIKWWQTWRISPMALTFTQTDWDFLLDTAVLHSAHWSGENTAAELRIRVAKFGATPEDRLRLRLQVDTDQDASKATSKTLTDQRRTRLLKVVGDNDQESTAVQL